MKRRLAITAIAASAILSGLDVSAQVNSPDAEGYLKRGVAMYRDRNYEGCLDQLLQLRQLHPSTAQNEEALFYISMSTLHSGDDEALTLLQEWLQRYPASPRRPEVMMAMADYYFTRGVYAQALERYSAVDPGCLNDALAEDWHYRTAYSNMLLGNYGQARDMFETLLGTRQYGQAARFYIGYIAYRNADYTTALKNLTSVSTDPELGASAEYYLSQIYFAKGDYEKSFKAAKSVIGRNALPQFTPEANRIAGESLYNMGREDEAIPYLRRYAAEASEIQPSAFYILGVYGYKTGNYAEAITDLQKVVGIDDPMGQSAYLTLGQCYVKEGNTNSALMAFEKAYKIDYDPGVSETAFYNYAVARMEGGRVPFGSSVKLFEDFLSQYPNSRYASNVQEYIITGYMTDNDYENALRSINRIKNPSGKVLAAKQRVLFVLGTKEYAAGKVSSALSRFIEAARITSGDGDIRRQCSLWQGNCFYDLNQYTNAANAYQTYLKASGATDPNRCLAYYNLGYTYMAEENFPEALKAFRKVIDLKPDNRMLADAYNRAGDCLYYQSQFNAAANDYLKAYDLNPSSGDYALFQLAVMKGLARDHKAKIESLDRLMEQFPSSALVPAALLEKAESYSALRQDSEAIAAYTSLVRNYPSTSYGRKGLLQLAITYINSDKRQQAIETYKKVIYTYPTSEEARVASDDLKRIYANDGRLAEYAEFIASVPNAPQIEPSELDALAFSAAESDYLNNDRTERLKSYLNEYPEGAYQAQVLYYLAESAYESGNSADALNYASQLILLHPDAEMVEDALLIRADSENEQGKREMALDTYRELEERASGARNLNEARLGIMRTAATLGKNAEVIEATDKLMASSAAGSAEMNEIGFYRAQALAATGDKAQAEKIWRKLSQEPDDIYGSRSAVALAELLLADGSVKESKKVIEEYINSNPPHQYWLARGFIVLSDVLRRQGNTFEADEYLKSLRSNYPGTESDIFQMIDNRLK